MRLWHYCWHTVKMFHRRLQFLGMYAYVRMYCLFAILSESTYIWRKKWLTPYGCWFARALGLSRCVAVKPICCALRPVLFHAYAFLVSWHGNKLSKWTGLSISQPLTYSRVSCTTACSIYSWEGTVPPFLRNFVLATGAADLRASDIIILIPDMRL